ncbi:MAG: hypothetical protein G01um10143_526 [Parcubacteria group bacterium Gr01-1014_3]|nr:MAG: hypothetical protein G01um10143_526 [Parcubacteria group bacterium Gr01-1014_3]
MHSWDWVVWLFRRFYTDQYVAQRYLLAVALVNDAMSYLNVAGGYSVDIDQRLTRWNRWEKEYVKRGYATLDCDFDEDPIRVTDKGRLTHTDILVKLKEGAKPFFASDMIIKMVNAVRTTYGEVTPTTIKKYLESEESEDLDGQS